MSHEFHFALWPASAGSLLLFWDVAIKSAFVLFGAGLAVACMRRHSAPTRHLVWVMGIASLLFLPLLSYALPSWQILPRWVSLSPEPPPVSHPGPILSPRSEVKPKRAPSETLPQPSGIPQAALTRQETFKNAEPERAVESRAQSAQLDLPSLVLLIWMAGAALALLPTGLGLISLWRLERGSRLENESDWRQSLDELVNRIELRRRVTLLKSARRRMPMTWGVFRPKLLLPEESQEWSAERRRMVMLHELAHIKRWDYLTNLALRFACALYWFNPLVWMAARRMIAERERACDDLVLRYGTKPVEYAEQILQLAMRVRVDHFTPCGGIAMARATGLEARLRAILDQHRNRGTLTRTIVFGAFAVAIAVVIPLSMLAAQPSPASGPTETAATNNPVRDSMPTPPSMITGYVIDADTQLPIPDFTVTPGSLCAAGDLLFWDPSEAVRGSNGFFRVTRPKSEDRAQFWFFCTVFKIETPQFRPLMVTARVLATNQTARMRRGEFVTGHVVASDGTPAAGVQVALRLRPALINIGLTNLESAGWSLPNMQVSPITTTDGQGQFKLRAGPGMDNLVASGEAGFAIVGIDPQVDSKVIQLKPWAKVTGSLRRGSQPLSGETVRIKGGYFSDPKMWYIWNLNARTETDADGRFFFDRLPPGSFSILYESPRLSVERYASVVSGSVHDLTLVLHDEALNRAPETGSNHIAWGPETNGIQFGLSVGETTKPFPAGAKVSVSTWLRNNRSEPVAEANWIQWHLSLATSTGSWVEGWNSEWKNSAGGGTPAGTRIVLAPGQQVRLDAITVEVPALPDGSYNINALLVQDNPPGTKRAVLPLRISAPSEPAKQNGNGQ